MACGARSDQFRVVTPPKSNDVSGSSGELGPLVLRLARLATVWDLLVMNCPAKLAVSILVTVGIVLAGCSKSSRPPTYRVTGTVTLKGTPVAGATITFVPTGQEGEAASAITDADGKYALSTWEAGDGARPGEYRVKVSKQEQATVDPSKMVQNLTIEEEQKIYVEAKKAPPPAKRLIPAKYEDDQTSGLTHTVDKKPTTFDIKIE